MKTTQITLYRVNIPFKTSINHNLKKRQCTESFIIEIQTENGRKGYGEGAPRKYVTGENIEQLIEQAQYLLNPFMHIYINDFSQIQQIVKSLQATPSIATAFEMALLDIWGQEHDCSISKLFGNSTIHSLAYSAVIPFLPLQKMKKWLELVEEVGFKQLKLKVGYEYDEHYLALIRERLGSEIEIRLDANRAWSFEEASVKIKALEKYQISSIEEPLKAKAIDLLPQLSQTIDTPIMLDESICTIQQAQYYAQLIVPNKLRFNLKLSKMGGIMAASKIHAFAIKNGIQCQLGCNVGETAILSTAGRLFAQNHQLAAIEGSYASFFMEDDIGVHTVMFGYQGMAQPILSNGLGVKINQSKLIKYSDSTIHIHPMLIA